MALKVINNNAWLNCRYFDLVIFFTIGATLCYSNVFIYQTLTPYYLYLTCISLLAILAGLLYPTQDWHRTLHPSIIVAAIWILYIFLHAIILTNGLNPFHIYLIASLFLYILTYLLLFTFDYTKSNFVSIIMFFALLETVICFLQFFHTINSLNTFFLVTGSWANPNVTGMFLAMTFPALFTLMIQSKRSLKSVFLVVCILVLIAVIMLRCRSALLGICIGSAVLLNNRYKIVKWLIEPKNRVIAMISAITASFTVWQTAVYLYELKKQSADSRSVIWSMCFKMVRERPLTGYGYGLFEKAYNEFQSLYYIGPNVYSSIKHTGYIHMSYNEFFENTVEGGLIGAVLLSAFLAIIIFKSGLTYNDIDSRLGLDIEYTQMEKRLHTMSYAGTLTFVCMSLVNFTIQAIPVMCIFAIYAALLAKMSVHTKVSPTKTRKSPTMVKILILVGIFGIYFTVSTAKASYKNKQVKLKVKTGEFDSSNRILKSIESPLRFYESYWVNYGDLLFYNGDYALAKLKYEHAKTLTSDPNLYLKTGVCYERLKDYNTAKENYLRAMQISPVLLSPRYALMSMDWRIGDTIHAILLARELIKITPKVSSKETKYYKQSAFEILRKVDGKN